MKIALLGDIAFFGNYSIENKYIYNYFSDVANKLHEFDHVIGNFETPFNDNFRKYGEKSVHISTQQENIKLLRYLNINIVNLANNHIYDFGMKGYELTKEILSSNGIDYFGIENRQIKINTINAKIALSGFCCYSTNGFGYQNSTKRKGINIFNAYEVKDLLLKNHQEGFLNIISIHAGQEHVHYPNYDHMKIARDYSNFVPYVYYGHHPHVIQGIENINGSLLAYSLGNFCFDDVFKGDELVIKQSEKNKKSFILSLEIKENNNFIYEIISLYANETKMDVGYRHEILDEIRKFSDMLHLDEQSYIDNRNLELKKLSKIVNKSRDITWYKKRLRISSLKKIINAYQNKKNYKIHIKDYANKI